MRAWLDDCRPMPDDFDTHVKTAEEAIALLQTNKVTLISLDHDLGTDKTGYDVAKWIEEHAANGTLKELCPRVHSQNPIGKRNIQMALRNACNYWMQRDSSCT